jgi:hypothetical protein
MKNTITKKQTTVVNPAILAFDVSKDRLNLATCIAGRMIDHEFAKRTLVIEEQLRLFQRRADMASHDQVLVVCEPTGCYHETLMQTAHRMGFETAWVSGEAVSKMERLRPMIPAKQISKIPM